MYILFSPPQPDPTLSHLTFSQCIRSTCNDISVMYSPLCEKSLAFSHGLTGVWIFASERIQETVQEAIYCYVQGLCTKVSKEGEE